MRFELAGGPHLPPRTSVRGVMGDVLLALLPGLAAHVWFFGPAVLLQVALAVALALALEALMLRARGTPPRRFLTDLSAPVTAVLYVLCLPPLMPWWTVLLGMFSAIVLAKHLYGGLGHNLFNPAMVGYAAVLVSFPLEATQWLPARGLGAEPALGAGEIAHAVLGGGLPADRSWDALSGATPLDLLRSETGRGVMVSEVTADPLFGSLGGRGWEWIAAGYLLGGLYLLYRRVISWHVPGAMLGTVVILTAPAFALDPDANPFPLFHVFTGGMLLGAFFIATDPVSGAASPRGRLIFGAGVAVLTLAIRRWGGYPDGVAFAVLLMNMAVPLIDRYTRPRVYGHPR